MIFVGRAMGLFKEDEGCEGFEEMMGCEQLGRWRMKNELECEGLGGGGGGGGGEGGARRKSSRVAEFPLELWTSLLQKITQPCKNKHKKIQIKKKGK